MPSNSFIVTTSTGTTTGVQATTKKEGVVRRYCHDCEMYHVYAGQKVIYTYPDGSTYSHMDAIQEGWKGYDDHVFRYGRLRPVRYQWDVWQDMYGKKKRLVDMSVKELKEAIGFIKKGYRVFGQAPKIISLEKELRKRNDTTNR